MDVHGNQEDRDVFGNVRRDAWGNQADQDVQGNVPRDGWGNPTPRSSGQDSDGGGLLDFLGRLFGG